MSSDYYGDDRYQQLSGDLMMDPRDYIESLEEMRDNDAADYRGLQEYTQKRDAVIARQAAEIARLESALDEIIEDPGHALTIALATRMPKDEEKARASDAPA